MSSTKHENTPQAKVLSINDYRDGGYYSVVIDKGKQDGVEIGDSVLIYSLGDEMFDLDTRESLGFVERVKGRGYATHVQDRITTITSNNREFNEFKSNRFMESLLGVKKPIQTRVQSGKSLPFNGVMVGDSVKFAK